jgi:hypothetical protein
MRFVQTKTEKFMKKTKLAIFLEGFVDSKIPTAEVADFDYVSAESGRNSLTVAAKRHCLPVRCVIKDGHLYLVNTMLVK